jgi:hypothetical protein
MNEPSVCLPISFLSLPPHQPHQPWPANVQNAHEVLTNIYKHAITILYQDSDPLQITFYTDLITSDAIPMLSVMEEVSGAASDEG